jgi:NADH:ubiquinone oxidoreductase subunit C
MTKEELKIKLTELFPSATYDESGDPIAPDSYRDGWLNMNIAAGDFLNTVQLLRNDSLLNFNYLFCLTCVDWKTHLTMVYHFTSTQHHQPLVVKVQLDRNKPEIETVSHIWRTADFHEREAYEMFGVNFLNHPDLRLLILPDGWEGKNPMLKDFEDPVNMIKL